MEPLAGCEVEAEHAVDRGQDGALVREARVVADSPQIAEERPQLEQADERAGSEQNCDGDLRATGPGQRLHERMIGRQRGRRECRVPASRPLKEIAILSLASDGRTAR